MPELRSRPFSKYIRAFRPWLAKVLLALAGLGTALPCLAQATSRLCADAVNHGDLPGPACLLASQSVGALADGAVYWSLYTYPTLATAHAERKGNAVVVESFGEVWLFTVGPLGTHPLGGRHVADVGPIQIESKAVYTAQFLKSVFSVGMTAPVHVHSGPEAFYAVSGDTCLETPEGRQFGQGPGNSLVVRRGPPMLLMAPGPEPRRGFALILHDSTLPPTTLVHNWTPKGLCKVTGS